MDELPPSHCILKAMLTQDSYEYVSGTGPLENLRSCHALSVSGLDKLLVDAIGFDISERAKGRTKPPLGQERRL